MVTTSLARICVSGSSFADLLATSMSWILAGLENPWKSRNSNIDRL
jgi:hypothetical protein